MKANRVQPVEVRLGERVFYYTYSEPVKDDRRVYWSTVAYWEDGREEEKASFHVSVRKKDLSSLFFQIIEMEIGESARKA